MIETEPISFDNIYVIMTKMGRYFTSLVFMIETMKRRCHKPVVLCAHSMGNQVLH